MEGELKSNPENRERVEAPQPPESTPEAKTAPTAERPAADLPKSTPLERPAFKPELTKDQQVMVMERILEDGLLDVFLAMTKDQRASFRATGEALAVFARGFIGRAKAIRPHRLEESVRTWLKTITGVNRFWLIQAVKIKTDGLLSEIRGQDENYV